jgi:hypothetical protein
VALSWSTVPGNDNFANGQVVGGSTSSVNASNLGRRRKQTSRTMLATRAALPSGLSGRTPERSGDI